MITFLQKNIFFCKNQWKWLKLACWERFQLFEKVFYHWRSLNLEVKDQYNLQFDKVSDSCLWKVSFLQKKCQNKFLTWPPLVWSRKWKLSGFFELFICFFMFFLNLHWTRRFWTDQNLYVFVWAPSEINLQCHVFCKKIIIRA